MQQELKAAAHRLRRYLDQRGVSLQQGMALDGLAQAVGEADWRTLRALLARHKAAPAGPDRWLVVALYSDNRQRYADRFPGESALQAQAYALVDRDADFGNAIEICAVWDTSTGRLADEESFASEVRLPPLQECLRRVGTCGQRFGAERAKQGAGLPASLTANLAWLTDTDFSAADNTPYNLFGHLSGQEETGAVGGQSAAAGGQPSTALRQVTAFVHAQPEFSTLAREDQLAVYVAMALLDYWAQAFDALFEA